MMKQARENMGNEVAVSDRDPDRDPNPSTGTALYSLICLSIASYPQPSKPYLIVNL